MNKIITNLPLILLSAVISLALISCSTMRTAELESATPESAIKEVSQQESNLVAQQVDLLAYKNFSKGQEKLNEAKQELKDEEDPKEIMTLAAQAKAYFQDAQSESNNKSQVPDTIIEARQMALDNGVLQSKHLKEKLQDLDEDLRDETDKFSQSLKNDKYSYFQKEYLTLKVKAIQHTKLGTARQVLDKAKSNKAKKKAPNTLSNSIKSISAAENLIAQNSSDPTAYTESVNNANQSAKLLDDVMNKISEMGEDTSERVALRLVYQDRKIGVLSSNIDDLKGNLNRTKTDMSMISGELDDKEQKLNKASSKLSLQENIKKIRQNFNDNEAEIYQQDEQVILRLKNIDFNVGSAELPTESMNLLSHVQTAIKDLNAESITIQGHTDSTGSNSLNNKLSKQRAETVAKYLSSQNSDLRISSEGYGETRPLTSNNTKEGRSTNRRVDIVITTQE